MSLERYFLVFRVHFFKYILFEYAYHMRIITRGLKQKDVKLSFLLLFYLS
jgi:hypothetical protein